MNIFEAEVARRFVVAVTTAVEDEPQTCSVNGRPYSECADCEYFKCTADEPQTELKGSKRLLKGKDEPQTEYERASEQREHDILYEPTYDVDNGSM